MTFSEKKTLSGRDIAINSSEFTVKELLVPRVN